MCGTCGIALRESAKFCDERCSPIALSNRHGEAKQVSVLFADGVRLTGRAEFCARTYSKPADAEILI